MMMMMKIAVITIILSIMILRTIVYFMVIARVMAITRHLVSGAAQSGKFYREPCFAPLHHMAPPILSRYVPL